MIEEAIRQKLTDLIDRAKYATATGVNAISKSKDFDSWEGWVTEALHIVELVLPNSNATYRSRIEEIAYEDRDTKFRVRDMGSILRGLLSDIELGLIVSLTNKIRAEAFDDFLDHAESYRSSGRKNEAGVIAGVIFEDTVRRVFRDKVSQDDAGKPLEELINALARAQIISGQQSKQAKVAAHVRTKATHAQWDEFDMGGVDATIYITRRLLGEQMGA
jgi:hypothetical protein